MKSYLMDVVCSIEPKLKGKQIRVTIDCAEDMEINSYPGLYAQIVTNLLLNSIIHGFADTNAGEIQIRAHKLDNRLSLQYRDDGKGIIAANVAKIFDPFFTTDKQKGTGLGMHIVCNISHKN